MKLNIQRSVLIAIFLYVVLVFINQRVMFYVLSELNDPGIWWFSTFKATALVLIYCLPGLLAGFLCRENEFTVGALVGLCCFLTGTYLFGVQNIDALIQAGLISTFLFSLVKTLAGAIISARIGGMIALKVYPVKKAKE